MSHTNFFVGSRQLQIQDEENGLSYPVLVQYPTYTAATPTSFGPYVMEVSVDADIAEGKFPLVIISHGNGGSHLLYRTISMHLVRNGYIAAMLEHYGNNRNNNTLENTALNLQYRPRHVSMTIEQLLTESWLQDFVAQDKIAVIGHSMGGYTALAVAGGIPWLKEGEKIDVTSNPRVKAIVLLAPGTGWFRDSLSKVTIPILMFMAEHDPVTPAWNAEVVLTSIPDASQVIHKVVENAGHFSFLSPFPETMRRPDFRPSTDPPGFDRDAFHKELPVEVLAFLEDTLNRTPNEKNKTDNKIVSK
ncbi:alpha/beta fold hydrolase [Cytophagaceae bacterium DM2B3-1]|uniref:Alpha/beta fold hydrolase n=1 Tax=Xanthocytophaga flava TaxID=3048013 RepID=A0ABT7CSY3_9BACT|nr:alpha/beta fold hydrolase [Xanthocytophaga flavus]MDJ1471539.1 alpha/beta fold hydrolase [Xanthocytophaga flavus]MDJ1496611.1 alpha/beta fold hydrolase [Xanthocytophaga flavus]